MKKNAVILLMSIALIQPGVSRAFTEPAEDGSVKTLDTVVVTGTRSEQIIEKVPANVSVIDAEDIKNSNAKNIVDLLKSEEGILVRDLLGNGKSSLVDLRGFGETGAYNSLVLVDGRRVNEMDLSGVDWSQIPLDQIERIEIVRGTGTVLYGDNAVGGVINIITKTPSGEYTFSSNIITGSYGRNKEQAAITGGSSNMAAGLYGSHDSTNGYRPGNEFAARDFGGKIVLYPNDILSLNISGSYHEDKYDLPGPLTEAQYLADRKLNANPLDRGNSEDYYIKTGLDLALGEYGSIITDFSYRKRTSEANFPDPSGVFPQGTRSETETYSLTPLYISESSILNHRNTFTAGIDLYRAKQDMDSFGGFFVPLTVKTGIADTERDSRGIYFNDEFSISEDLILSIGARHERVRYSFNQKDLSAFPLAPLDTETIKRGKAYSAGLTFMYNDRSSVFVRANKSLRFPLTDEVTYVDWATWKIMANTGLQPQLGEHYEAGVKHFFTPDIRCTFTLFTAGIKNELFYNPLTFSNENHPETLHRGIETGIKADLLGRVTLYGNYTYQKAEYEKDPYKGNDIPAVPEHRANLGVMIRNILPGLNFSTDYSYAGSSYAISDHANSFEKLGHHYTLDSKISYDWRSFETFIGVNNITNQEYAGYAVMDTFLTTRNFYPSPERTWTAGLKFTF